MTDHKASGINPQMTPDTQVSVREVFGIDQDLTVPAFSVPSEHVPEADPD